MKTPNHQPRPLAQNAAICPMYQRGEAMDDTSQWSLREAPPVCRAMGARADAAPTVVPGGSQAPLYRADRIASHDALASCIDILLHC